MIRDAIEAWIRAGLALVLILIIGSALFALFGHPIPVSNHDVVILILGGLLAKLTDVYQWAFGSTAGNARKDSTINTLAQTAQTAGNALGSGDTITLAPGDKATATATDAGTVIDKTTTGDSP